MITRFAIAFIVFAVLLLIIQIAAAAISVFGHILLWVAAVALIVWWFGRR